MKSEIAIEHTTLGNGLRVVAAPDHAAPVVTVGVFYRVGSRLEPRGRSGFAHLFEHMMFQGSPNVPKGAHIKLINSSGGRANGSTGYDVTSYFEAVPSNTLERVLWLEADRMRALKVDADNLTNQRNVVKEEIRRNLLNQPYGSFPWLDLPAVAFRNWANAHSLYGEFEDLDAAELEDVQAFFKTYYVPNNAVLVMLGDVDAEEAITLSMKYFADIPAGRRPDFPDTNEPEQKEERCGFVAETFGTLPALAVGYRIPERMTVEWGVMALLDLALHGGRAGRIYQELVIEKQIAVEACGGIDDLFGSDGPALMTTELKHRNEHSARQVLASFDEVIRKVRESGVSLRELEQLKLTWLSKYYEELESGGGYIPKCGLMHFLACLTLFDDNPHLVNTIPETFLSVTTSEISSVADRYLRSDNRAIVFRAQKREPHWQRFLP